MRVKILKNIKYKGKPIKRGSEIEITEDSIEEFIEKGIIDDNFFEIQELEKNDLTEQPTTEDEEIDLAEQPTSEEDDGTNVIGIDDITKDAIIEILAEKGIEHNPRDKKENLYNLMVQGD